MAGFGSNDWRNAPKWDQQGGGGPGLGSKLLGAGLGIVGAQIGGSAGDFLKAGGDALGTGKIGEVLTNSIATKVTQGLEKAIRGPQPTGLSPEELAEAQRQQQVGTQAFAGGGYVQGAARPPMRMADGGTLQAAIPGQFRMRYPEEEYRNQFACGGPVGHYADGGMVDFASAFGIVR